MNHLRLSSVQGAKTFLELLFHKEYASFEATDTLSNPLLPFPRFVNLLQISFLVQDLKKHPKGVKELRKRIFSVFLCVSRAFLSSDGSVLASPDSSVVFFVVPCVLIPTYFFLLQGQGSRGHYMR